MSRRLVVGSLVPVYLALIAGIPLAAAVTMVAAAPTPAWRVAAALAAAPVASLLYVLVAGTLSRLTMRAVVPGKYPRDLGHHVYGPRRLYALGWTAIYYFGPLYHAVLAVPALKRLTFRLFGYRGAMDFQTYPDTWVRDLPLLTLGSGAYLSNKATISPNMCLQDGSILVQPVRIGARAMIGHLAMIAPGVEVGDDAEIGVGASLGVRATVGAGTFVGHCVQLDHQAQVGAGCELGTRAYVGRKAILGDGLRVPAGVVIAARSVLRTQAEVDAISMRQGMDRLRTPLAMAAVS